MDFVVVTECEIDVHDACCDEEAAVSEARQRIFAKVCKCNPGYDVELIATMAHSDADQHEETR